jgi:Holliday junction resolvase RusA-like endonuclease
MKSLLIQNFPLPPSENQLYRNLPRVGRVATQELKNYRRECEFWGLANKNIRELFFSVMEENPQMVLKVDFYFVFKRDRLWTKDNRPKKLDASNRVKAAADQLAKFFNIDDKCFFNVSAEKVSGENECCIIFITPISPMSAVEILNNFRDSGQDESESIQ